MAKKDIPVIRSDEFDPSPDETKPIQESKNIFKDPTKSETTSTVEDGENIIEEAKPKKKRHGKWVWLGILIMLVLTAAGAAIGYSRAVKVRLAAETDQRITFATTQFMLAQQDQDAGRLDMSRQRLEAVFKVYPDYPGLTDKLKEVLLALALVQAQSQAAIPTPQPEITPVATSESHEVSTLLKQAQEQLAASDWQGLLVTVNSIRNIDPTFEPIKVDGLFYYALRYNGIAKIQNGNLEVGLYYLAMARQLAPIDSEADGWERGAKLYLSAASWFGIDWYKAAEGFFQTYQTYPSLVDISGISAKQRYGRSLEGIGDVLQASYSWCEAVPQYEAALGIITDQVITDKLTQARAYCAQPPATPTPTLGPDLPTPTPTP
jgi:hypothetical protein